jgi:hypothetical protein
MNDIDLVILIQWKGPFSTVDELKKWEISDDHSSEFNLYLLKGQKKSVKTNFSYYCGQTTRKYVSQRIKYNHRHYVEIKNRPHEIWIGRFSNDRSTKHDLNIVENLITSVWEPNLNKTNFRPPLCDVCVVNLWYNKNDSTCKRLCKKSPPSLIPDVIVYDSSTKQVLGAQRLKFIKQQ